MNQAQENFKKFIDSRRVMSNKKYEEKFGCDLGYEGSKISVYLEGFYIVHTGHKFLAEYDRSAVLLNTRSEAERHLFDNFVEKEYEF